jgi:hypothetical protein
MISYKIAPLPRASVLGQDAGIAQMAELVDALGSGPSGGNTVEVRVLFWAPRNIHPNPRIYSVSGLFIDYCPLRHSHFYQL